MLFSLRLNNCFENSPSCTTLGALVLHDNADWVFLQKFASVCEALFCFHVHVLFSEFLICPKKNLDNVVVGAFLYPKVPSKILYFFLRFLSNF